LRGKGLSDEPLKIRVALSAVLIGFLVVGYFQGWISTNAG